MAAVSVTVITTLTSTTTGLLLPTRYLTADDNGINQPVTTTITTTVAPSLQVHYIHQNQNQNQNRHHHHPLLWKRTTTFSKDDGDAADDDDDDDDDDDGWKYVLRLYACGYRSGDYGEAIQPPPGQICVLDLRDGLYGFCKDPAEKHHGKLNLKRDCGGWRGGCVDDFGCKKPDDDDDDDASGDKGGSDRNTGGRCGVVGEEKGRKRFEGVETCTGNNPYCAISELRFSTSADAQVYRRFGCNAYPTTIDYLITPHTVPPLATVTATSSVGKEGGGEGGTERENPSSGQQEQQNSRIGSIIGGVIGGIALICLTLLMVRCMDARNTKKKQKQRKCEGGEKLEIEAVRTGGSEERQQDDHGGEKGTGWKEWLGYYRLLSLLPPALNRHNKHFAHHNERPGHSETGQRQNPCQRQPGRGRGRISSSISSPSPSPWIFTPSSHLSSPAAATKTTKATARSRTTFKFFSSWAKRKPSPLHRHHAELPEECFTPGAAAISGCKNEPTPAGRRLPVVGSHQQGGANGLLLCELPAEVPRIHSRINHRRSHEVNEIVGSDKKRGMKEIPPEKELPRIPNGDENAHRVDGYDDVKTSSPCPSRESGPLGNIEVIEKKSRDSEGTSSGRWF